MPRAVLVERHAPDWRIGRRLVNAAAGISLARHAGAAAVARVRMILADPSSIAAGGAGHASSLSDQEGPLLRLPYLKLLNRDDTKTEVRVYPPQFESGEVIYPNEKAIRCISLAGKFVCFGPRLQLRCRNDDSGFRNVDRRRAAWMVAAQAGKS